MTGFSWAATLFGARQLESLLLADTDRATAAFNAVAAAARSGLGGGLDQVFHAGERWQSEMVDYFMPGSRELVEISLGMLEQSAKALRAVPGQESAGRELANKVRAFRDFQYVESLLGVAGDVPLAARVEEAAGLGSYRRLWATEGLGFAHAERAWRDRRVPRGLLHDREVPAAAVIPLHTGMGLSLAMRALGAIETRGDDAALGAALERFRALCAAGSAPACEPMALEALGLVVRTLHPHLLQRVDRLLAAVDRELVAYYWHSVGRALYFVPTHVLPGLGAAGRALRKARREPPHELGRRNALAGFGWALTLVNIRHPEVLGRFLRDHADEIFDHSAFANGVSSAALVWYRANGLQGALTDLLGHLPEHAAGAETWRRLVREPVAAALRSYPDLERRRALGTLFRHRPPDDGETAAVARSSCCQELPAVDRFVDGWLSRTFQSFTRHGPGEV